MDCLTICGIDQTKAHDINRVPGRSLAQPVSLKRTAEVSISGERSLKTISRRGDYVGFWLRVLSNGVSRTFEKSLQNYDVTVARWVVLRALYGRETSLIELSEAIGIDQGSTSRLVERLVQKKLVNRVTPPEDRRSVRISLTSSGFGLVPKLASAADINDELFFGKISKAKKDQFLKTLMELIRKNDVPPVAFD
jgi:DNA-binding MarR family transcriptional regulator